ncbi:DUF501 domain-containing protein [Parahalioglobus pacificus]|uniref:DUF501 domain-containing protein n=1 Tax=Parahalioglobus pacificus TaxID=930806 RepID=A0A918XDP5_9GAMM|nr:DUF501 domain-containing protein [Halioglobus pacificus]GHD27137.1 hypothetical protein GCM10007053_05030 [Halioglobus pacificus]
MAVSEQQRAQVARLIGREPRGLEAIPVSDDAGVPRVIRVASLVDGKPFPTLFWLVDADLNYRIDVVEAGGLIKRLQQRIDEDPELQAGMTADHQSHIRLRDSFITEEQRQALADGGFAKALSGRGIGGIADFTRIRCLHTWYAAHLVEPNTVGQMLDAYWQAGQQQ